MVEKRSKPLPEGYICKACGSDSHSIHDCPSKIPKKQKIHVENSSASSNQKNVGKEEKPSKPSEKVVDSSEDKNNSRKVYVSGLPFHITKPKLKEILEEASCDVAFIQLVCFPDNPSKCKGVAFVTFRDEESAPKAIALTGTEMDGKVLKIEAFHKSETSETSAQGDTQSVKASNKRCYRCGGKHEAKTCTNARICYRCKSEDHLSFDCPQKKPAVNPRKKVFSESEDV